jgi:hypothetical protein
MSSFTEHGASVREAEHLVLARPRDRRLMPRMLGLHVLPPAAGTTA